MQIAARKVIVELLHLTHTHIRVRFVPHARFMSACHGLLIDEDDMLSIYSWTILAFLPILLLSFIISYILFISARLCQMFWFLIQNKGVFSNCNNRFDLRLIGERNST